MTDIHLKCSCGKVQGCAFDVKPDDGIRVVCHCDNCQAFAKYLGRENEILDEYGGTDIFQMSPYQILIEKGKNQIRSVRLTKKGPYRWYTDCCKTPIGNSLHSEVPFVGVIHNFMDDEDKRDKNLGPVRFYVQGKYALKKLPDEKYNEGYPLASYFKIMFKILVWRFSSKKFPSPFFDEEGNPISKPKKLYSE
ncbi:MAG: hypothetical protein KDF58_12080 [Alphaproteobacteria bacterium]|nr:hypothetical protein [Alphaproteobacteria bacterium]HPF47658.1 DUF6151 family protein [Emcibacteraceae bacterium]HRW28474.1 DUF6151 family protein [Emcibacteraceae bacterium]